MSRNKKLLKRTEHLQETRNNMNVWTLDGKIMFKGSDDNQKVYRS